MLKKVILFFFLVNSLFWGLASHSQHCNLAYSIGIEYKKCPPHWIHVYIMGLGSFLLTLYLNQNLTENYLNNYFNYKNINNI